MAPRQQLQTLLEALLGLDHVYFQPPPSKKMEYPAIVYKLDRIDINHADNKPYTHANRYQVTVIDRNPDSEIPKKVATLSSCSFDRSFPADGLNHTAFNLYF
jgi:hypothetical protein